MTRIPKGDLPKEIFPKTVNDLLLHEGKVLWVGVNVTDHDQFWSNYVEWAWDCGNADFAGWLKENYPEEFL